MELTLKMLKPLLWMLGLLAVISFGARYTVSTPKTRNLNIRGVELNMSMEQVKNQLGKPDSISDNPPKAKGGAFWIYYYGPLAVSQECLGVQFDSSHKVWAVDGESISRGSELVGRVNDREGELVRALGTPLSRAKNDNEATRCDFVGGLSIHLLSNRATNFMLSSPEYDQADTNH